MNKTLCCLFIILATAALATADVVPGRPGHYEIYSAIIDASGGLYGPYTTASCLAWYTDPVEGNTVISNYETMDTTSYNVNVVKDGLIMAMCKFTDNSGVYEKNAEVGDIIDCTLYTVDGETYEGGTGQVVSAANIKEDGTLGGNTTIKCTFKNKKK